MEKVTKKIRLSSNQAFSWFSMRKSLMVTSLSKPVAWLCGDGFPLYRVGPALVFEKLWRETEYCYALSGTISGSASGKKFVERPLTFESEGGLA